ncbi:MAG: hypothetical protein HZC02_03770 [Candidatus Levybacteria bacterium]|nr:hypothetical protein [Candidatus Levybacteria bacterium]
MDQSSRRNSSLSVFLFGILFGVFVTLLFTTKKGKRVLKAITDEGVERFSRWEDMISAVEQEMDNANLDDDEIVEEKIIQQDNEGDKPELISSDDVSQPDRKKRRIFKGIRRKTS